ncbi:energy transducer TonB [Rhodanobacter sp. AS-Z3]|uniref:energy transducer TonB n=1 Tax=Rhodanobacter sp. AS-Z3 TaxID=3031330 RepID=UPI00247A7BFF|nr:energy transducer TonB [Rhodanobacter sp. AS-Z3]WEN15437.1 energy transducer TonB [Rhodanobacter sp. AS-Z3]
MLRLRVTSSLSLLALAIGIVGTGWLSTLTEVWPGPPQRYLAGNHLPVTAPARHSRTAARAERASRRPTYRPVSEEPAPPATPATPELIPLATPSDNSQSWDVLRGHLDGRVVMHVDIDGGGRVSSSRISQSSGDPVLDEHALRSVRGWRFAVPTDYPNGFAGELPMRFSSRGDGVSRLP